MLGQMSRGIVLVTVTCRCKQNRDGILPWPWQNLQPCIISLGISVHTWWTMVFAAGQMFPPECCVPSWMRLSGCCAMKTFDRGVRTVLGAVNIPSGHYSSCRLISIIVGTVLHSTALFFECLYTWLYLGSALQKFSLPVVCSGGGCLPKKGLLGLLKGKSHAWVWGEGEVPASTVNKSCAWLTSHTSPSHAWTLQFPSHTSRLEAQLCLCLVPEGWKELQSLDVATWSITGGC